MISHRVSPIGRLSASPRHGHDGPGDGVPGLVLATGFSILTFSQFQPNRVLGMLMAVTVIGGLLGDLILLPALLAPARAPKPL